jgi:hypothetical protein
MDKEEVEFEPGIGDWRNGASCAEVEGGFVWSCREWWEE